MTTKNELILRSTLQAFIARDLAAFEEYLDPEVVWHSLGGELNPIGGDHAGKGEVLSFLAKTLEMTDGSLGIEIHDVLASQEHAVALLDVTGRRGAKALDDRQVFVVRFRADKIREIWSYAGNAYKAYAFWG